MDYKVINNNIFNVGLQLENDETGRDGINVSANSFVVLSDVEVEYQKSKCSLFSNGALELEEIVATKTTVAGTPDIE